MDVYSVGYLNVESTTFSDKLNVGGWGRGKEKKDSVSDISI